MVKTTIQELHDSYKTNHTQFRLIARAFIEKIENGDPLSIEQGSEQLTFDSAENFKNWFHEKFPDLGSLS